MHSTHRKNDRSASRLAAPMRRREHAAIQKPRRSVRAVLRVSHLGQGVAKGASARERRSHACVAVGVCPLPARCAPRSASGRLNECRHARSGRWRPSDGSRSAAQRSPRDPRSSRSGRDPECFKPWDANTKYFQWPAKKGPYRIALANGFVGNTWRIQMIKMAKAYAGQPEMKSQAQGVQDRLDRHRRGRADRRDRQLHQLGLRRHRHRREPDGLRAGDQARQRRRRGAGALRQRARHRRGDRSTKTSSGWASCRASGW